MDAKQIKTKIQQLKKSGREFVVAVKGKYGITEIRVKSVVADYTDKFAYTLKDIYDNLVFVEGRDIISVM